MGWVSDHFEQQIPTPTLKPVAVEQQVPAWQETWDRICDRLAADAEEYNANAKAKGKYNVSRINQGAMIQVIPSGANSLRTATLEMITKTNGTMKLTGTIDGPGVPHIGHFQIKDSQVLPLENFVGSPKPTGSMTPEEFSEFVLKPVFFGYRGHR